MAVWVFPEKQWQELGDVRWEAEVHVTPKGWDTWTEDQRENFEPTNHPSLRSYFKTHAEAVKIAKRWLKRDDLAFGSVTIQKQIVDWYVEEDRIAEWADVGDTEYVD